MKPGSIVAAVALLLCAGGLSRAQVTADDRPPPSPVAVKFGAMCAGCHGPRGSGAEAPSLIDPVWAHGGDDASVARSIRTGFGTKMPAFAEVLSETEITGMVGYLRDQKAALAAAQARNKPDPLPTGVVRTEAESFRIEAVAKTGPAYAMAVLPDGRILVTEAAGALRIIDNGRLLPEPVQGLALGEMPKGYPRRLLDVVAHPDFKANGWIYLSSAARQVQPDGSEAALLTVRRGRIKAGRWTDEQTVLQVTGEGATYSKMAFDAQRRLYFTTGFSAYTYTGEPEAAPPQDLSKPDGKVLRVEDDGRIPADNPFVKRAGALASIWSYGHRAPLGIAFDPEGRLWLSENGPRGGDELNLVRKGANYGWPVITWGHRYDAKLSRANPDQEGMEQPVVSWVPSPAISAVAFYGGGAFPRWKGNLFVGSLKGRTLYRIVLSGERAVLQESILINIDRFRDVRAGPDGLIYLLTDAGDVMRLVPAAGAR